MAFNVLEEYPSGRAFSDNSGHVWPQVAFIVGAPSLAGVAEGLAGVASKHGVDMPPPWSPVEGPQVIPDRRGGEVSGTLAGDKDLPGVFLPLDPASRVESWLGEHEAHVEATASGTQGHAVFGTWHHVITHPFFLRPGSGGEPPPRLSAGV